MSNCSSCPSKGTCGKSEDTCGIQNNARNKIKHVIGVMSGKGGVGKSSWMPISPGQVFQDF